MTDKPLTGEILHASDRVPGGAFYWHCCQCGRMVLSETVYIDGEGQLHCSGCKQFDDLTEA